MTATTLEATTLIGGADTHADTIHVAAIDTRGRDVMSARPTSGTLTAGQTN